MDSYVVVYVKDGEMMTTQFYASSDKGIRNNVLRITGLDIDKRDHYY